MLYNLIDKLNNSYEFDEAKAHCDIPCKIYDPIIAQIAVLTIIRTVDLINELEEKDNLSSGDNAQFSRLVSQKEEHGIRVKEEIRVIWGDYFKEPQISEFPEIHELTHKIMLAASKSKQNIDKNASLELLDNVNRFAEIFWKTKGVNTFKATSPYPPALELIYPDLKG
tara:strand:+ start:531 stop:1034 length:504 start_codon:yes stop_codon:yes gene_type:complete